MEEETTESHTWARTRMGLKSLRLSWIFKITFFYFFTLFISSLLPTSHAKIPRSSFSDSFGYLDLEPNNEIAELDAYNFKSVILEYPTVFVYYNFENSRKNAAILQTLELVAQLLSNKNVLVARVTDKQFAQTLDINESGTFCAYHKGLTFPFYGYPVADVIMHFILKIQEPVVKEIIGKETKIAFDNIDVPKLVGFFEEENEEYSVFEEAALSYLPYVQFYATFDETVATHLKLPQPGTYRYRRPLEETSFLIEENLGTTEDVHRVIEKYRNGPLQKFSLHNIYHPWNTEEREDEFIAFVDPKSPKGKTFHKILTKFVRTEMERSKLDVKITWIDPSEYPMMIPIWEAKYEINLNEPHFGHIADSEVPRRKKVRWLDIPRMEEFEGKNQKHSVMKKWIQNEEDPYTPEEPEPEENDADAENNDDDNNNDVNDESEKSEEDSDSDSCNGKSGCSDSESDGTDSDDSEAEVEGETEENEAVTEENKAVTQEPEENDAYEATPEPEDEWADYFDRLEEMEMKKDQEKKTKVKKEKEKVTEDEWADYFDNLEEMEMKKDQKMKAKVEEERVTEEEWTDYFDNLEDMEMSKDQEKKTGVKKEKVAAERKPSTKEANGRPAAASLKTKKAKQAASKPEKREHNQVEEENENVQARPKAKTRNVKIEETLKEINKLVDIITSGENGHDAIPGGREIVDERATPEDNPATLEDKTAVSEDKTAPREKQRQTVKPKAAPAVKIQETAKDQEKEPLETEAEQVDKQENLKTADEIMKENEALRKENVELRGELKEEFEEDDEDDDEDEEEEEEEETPVKPGVKRGEAGNVYKDFENYPTYGKDLDVLVDTFEEEPQDEWDVYFDDLEQKKSSEAKEKKSPVKKKKKVPESYSFKEEDYPHYNVDLDVLVDSFESQDLNYQDEYTKYFDALEAEEDRILDGKVKKIKKKNRLGGPSFFAMGMPMKDQNTRIRQFLEREKQRREQMKQKVNMDSIKRYLKEKSRDKKKDTPKETLRNENDNVKENIEEAVHNDKTQEQNSNPEIQQNSEDSSIIQRTLLKLVKDVESLLYQNGHTNGDVKADTATNMNSKGEEDIKKAKEAKLTQLKGEIDREMTSKFKGVKGEAMNLFPANIDLTDPDSIVDTIKHTTNMANKLMKEFADTLTSKILDMKGAKPGNGDDDDEEEADEPWEVIEERHERLQELCKQGRLSTADCNQVIHGRSMEHVHSFHEKETPRVPRFKPSPPSPPEEAPEEPTKGEQSSERAQTTENIDVPKESPKKPIEIVDVPKESAIKDTAEADTHKDPDEQSEPAFDDGIMSETGTNFDESIFYDQETIDSKEEEKFYYKFEDWESPASSSPVVTEKSSSLDYRSQKYFDELEATEREQPTVQNENIVDDQKKVKTKTQKESLTNNAQENDTKKNQIKDERETKDKKVNLCQCEKESKKLKGKKDKHYDEEEWEGGGKFKGKSESSDSQPCDCKWKLLP